MKNQRGQAAGTVIISIIIVALLGGWLFPRMNWGKFQWTPAEVVTVSGTARSQQQSQLSSYTAGVDVVKDKKEDAIKETNDKVNALIQAVKDFGIDSNDIKTQNMSVYQNEEMYWEGGVQKARKGQWRVSNQVEITLRDISKASQMADLLTSTGATNVWGPNFRLDDTSEIENSLIEDAIKDARAKAEKMAQVTGRKLGKVLTVNEGGVTNDMAPFYGKMEGGGGGAVIEPGSGTVSKTVVVTFELK